MLYIPAEGKKHGQQRKVTWENGKTMNRYTEILILMNLIKFSNNAW